MSQLQKDKAWCVLEVGPGQALTSLVRQHGSTPNELRAVATLPVHTENSRKWRPCLRRLAGFWQCGIAPDRDAVNRHQQRLRVSLPSYPFERKRHWIDAPNTAAAIAEPRVEEPHATPVVAPVNGNRRERLLDELLVMLRGMSGLDLKESSGSTFLDLGFDSLFLTQVTQSVETRYGVRIRFAQLMNDLCSPDRLAAFLDTALPAEAVRAATDPSGGTHPVVMTSAQPTLEPAVTAAVPAGSLERLMKEQLQAFNELAARQIEMMKSLGAPVAEAMPAAAPSSVAVVETRENTSSTLTAFGPYKPPQQSAAGALTPRQQGYLDAFMERYNQRTGESKR